ncbi:helix-turn-helix domain-containing protein [Arthrobacter sp. ISL-95]|uniref:helix-turn-helix domain-containing protein n=1 Tax=Arthrobacter sp. ISL-95 TaxID=2819116 RepID=UPI001BEAE104|nr:helix-turn-helix domain-containing protein [Arthrobacter sp. ISL-95]MBT2586415.1 helix-turn-helix domain-containing protein [Arthrobacter sp. ISL-95]
MTPDSPERIGAVSTRNRVFDPPRSIEPDWTDLIGRLWKERALLVSDFLERFAEISYGQALVPAEDIYRTAEDTMDLLLFRMAGVDLPPDLQSLPREIARRRANQGVPLEAFLEAIRNDFRVLWKGLERVAGDSGIALLVANMTRVLDTVEGYVSSIQQAYAEEEARLTRNKQLYRQRILSRLFNSDVGVYGDAGIPGDFQTADEVEEMAAALGVEATDTFEVLGVASRDIAQAQRQFESVSRAFLYEHAGALYIFRQQRKNRSWGEAGPDFPAGYVPDVKGLTAVPSAAKGALVLANQRSAGAGLATVENTWMGIASALLEQALPGFSAPITEALDQCTPHERQRLLQVARIYGRTGSIKETSEELYCHRNTTVNRLHNLQQVIGLDLTVPVQAALALVALSGYEDREGKL